MVRDLPKAAGGILSYFTRHGTAANLLLVVLIIAGLVSLPRMRMSVLLLAGCHMWPWS